MTASGISYGSIGHGDPLIMVNGMGTTMGSWPPSLLSELAEHHRVIVYDFRGVGLSRGNGDFAFEDLVDDLRTLMDDLEIDRADMMGFSMGAMIVAGLLAERPGRCRRAVLLAGEPGGERTIPPSEEMIELLTNPPESPEEAGRALLGAMFPSEWFERHPDPREYYPIEAGVAPPDVMARQSVAIYSWEGCNGNLSEVRCPVMILHGKEDRITPVDNGTALLESIPGSVLLRFEHAGHGLMYQCPREMAGIVDDFLLGA